MTAEVGEAATGIGGDIASAAKDQANTLLSALEAVARRTPPLMVATLLGLVGIDVKRLARETAITIVLDKKGATRPRH